MRNHFDEQLVELNRELIRMGALCEVILGLTARALVDADEEALKMITDMERIGDQAEDIAEIIPFLGGRTGAECHDIRWMANAATKMVTDSVEAYVRQNLALARAVMQEDDGVDRCFAHVKSALISMVRENADDGEYALDLLMIAKYFERIGDHATNIAEWVEFSVTGVHKSEENE